MERLTEQHHNAEMGYYIRCSEHRDNDICDCGCETFQRLIQRMGDIETILCGEGREYELDRLRELAMADRERRCIILPAGSGDGHADPSGRPGEEGPPGLGPLHPVFERRQQ